MVLHEAITAMFADDIVRRPDGTEYLHVHGYFARRAPNGDWQPFNQFTEEEKVATDWAPAED